MDDATFVEIVSPAARAALRGLSSEFPAGCQKVKVGCARSHIMGTFPPRVVVVL